MTRKSNQQHFNAGYETGLNDATLIIGKFLLVAVLCVLALLAILYMTTGAAKADDRYPHLWQQQARAAAPAAVEARHGVPGLVVAAASRHGVPAALALAVARVESGFRCDARGQAGELGPLQIKPATARGLGYVGPVSALRSCGAGLEWGMRHLAVAYRRCGTQHGAATLHNRGLGAACVRTAYSARALGRGA